MFHRVAAVCIILALTCNLCAATGSFDIQLERVSYSVVEGNTVEVCVLLTDVVALNREANLTVQFTGAQRKLYLCHHNIQPARKCPRAVLAGYIC